MGNQLFTDGDVKQLDGRDFECVGVSYAETDGEKSNFVYSFRLKSELDAEREAEAQRVKDLEAAQGEPMVDETVAPEPEQPKPIEEETQHVR